MKKFIRKTRTVEGDEMLISPQKFDELFDYISGTVDVYVNGVISTCPLFQDTDGDIGFIYRLKPYYFKYLKSI